MKLLTTTIILAFIFCLPTYGQELNTGLLGHWTFDEGSGNTAGDSSGNEKHGALVPVSPDGPGWTTEGRLDGALEFDGVDDYVDFGDVLNDIDIQIPFTVSTWVKTSGGIVIPDTAVIDPQAYGRVISVGSEVQSLDIVEGDVLLFIIKNGR